MDETEKLLESIVNGIREKKGESISTVDLRAIDETICRYFVVCQAETPNHLLAITDSIRDVVQSETGRKPAMVDGEKYAHWIAMDYGEIVVHLFIPELRRFYDIEHLWADAAINELPED